MNIIDGACKLVTVILIVLTYFTILTNTNYTNNQNEVKIDTYSIEKQKNESILDTNAYKVQEVAYLTLYDETETDTTPTINNNEVPVGEMSELEYNVAMCESSMNNTLVGDLDSKYPAYGLYQFQVRTFNSLKVLAGMSELSIDNARDQLKLFRWAITNGYGSYWTCYNKLYQ